MIFSSASLRWLSLKLLEDAMFQHLQKKKKGHLFRNLRHFYGFDSVQLTGLVSCEML